MKLTLRQINLIRLISKYTNGSLKDFSELLGISLQTVKNDLSAMEALMAEYNVKVEILPGNSLRLWGEEHVNYMLNAFQTMQEFSLDKQIMLYLLCRDDYVTLQEMADSLYISKSLVEKVMSVMLEKYPEELTSMRRHGIRNISSQMERRSRFAKLLHPYLTGMDFGVEMKAFNTNHFPILNYVQEAEIKRAAEAIDYVRQTNGVSFTDEAIAQLFLQLVYAQMASRCFKGMDVGSLAEDMIEELPQVMDCRSIVAEICRLAGLEKSEETYFSYLFLMLRKQKMANQDQCMQVMQHVLDDLFARIHQRLAVDFSHDRELFEGLAVHIYSTVIRRDKLGREMGECMGIAEVRNQYPLGFEMAVIAAEVILERFSYQVPSGEMMYLTLHFQAGIERMKDIGRKVRVLVVCHYGLAAASLIAVRLEQMFPAIEVVDRVSVQHFLHMNNVEVDLVLSTENIEESTLPVIYVTPMLLDSEVKQIRRFVETKCTESLLSIFLQNATVVSLQNLPDKEAVLKKAVDILSADGDVHEGYLNSLLEREKYSSTDIEDIAIPHGNPDFVSNTQMLVLRFSKAVDWGHSGVHTVFLFAISRQQFKQNFHLFSNFYKRLARVQVRSELRKLAREKDEAFKKSLTYLLCK